MGRVEIGRDAREPRLPIVWDSHKVVNGNFLVVGESGVGKTFFLRKMISQLASQDAVRIYVFDCHGDLELDPAYTSSIKFSEGTTFGINPLIPDPDPDQGGVRQAIRRFISMVDRYSRVLGDKQRQALFALMEEFYRAYGYDPDDPSTWRRRDDSEAPSFLDFKNYSREKIKSLYLGSSGDARKALDALSAKLRSLGINGAREHEQVDREELSDLRGKCRDTFDVLLDSLQSGREIDQIIDEPERDVMKSIHKRIETLYASGIFKNRKPAFNPNKRVWRLDVFNLTNESRGFLVEIYLSRIFQKAKQEFMAVRQGRADHATAHVIVLDEGHLFMPSESDKDHIILRLIREGRKYLISSILASQSHSHFPDEVATGCASKLILGLDPQYHERIGRILGIKPSRFKSIEPCRSGLVQIKTRGDAISGYVDVLLAN